MTHPARRLPGIGRTPAPATLPPAGLDGLDPAWSALLCVPESADDGGDTGRINTWHVLDNGPQLAAMGVEPVGTILCVHGNPTWSYLWRDVLRQASAAARAGGPAWRVVAVDQLDMGFSERTGVLVRPLARRVRDLADLTGPTGLDLTGPVVTFGHDWGGVVSLGWAVDHPDRLAGVMLLNTAVHQPDDAAVPAPLRLALGAGVLGRATVTTPAFLTTTLSLAHPALPAPVADAYRAPYRGAARRGGIGGFVADIPLGDHPSVSELDRIARGVTALDVPALLLWGPRDPVFRDRYLDDLQARLPHADVHRFERAGHMIAEDVDIAGLALTWLGRRADAAPDAAPPPVEPAPDAVIAREPLWQHLDERFASDEVALIEMPRVRGGAMSVRGDKPGRCVSWKLLSRRVRELAAGFDAIGMRHGDRVSLLVTPGADLTAVLYACIRIGAVVVVADAGLGIGGLTRAVRGARPDFIVGALPGLSAARALGWPGRRIATTALPGGIAAGLRVEHTLVELARRGARSLAAGEPLPVPPRPSDEAAVLFTSGSTGPAKGVVYTHEQLAAVRDALSAQFDVGPDTGLVAGFAPFALLGPALGARSVTPDMEVTSPRTLTAVAVAAAVREASATVLFLSPAALANVVATADLLSPSDHLALEGVRTFLSAGAPVSAALLDAARTLLPNARAHTPYGMTEGLLMTDGVVPGQAPLSAGICVGTPAASVQVRVSALDELGHASGPLTADPDVTGEVVVAAPHVLDHYDRLWATNTASRAGTPSDRHWHRTGDVGHLDADGRLWIEGRLQHVITAREGRITPVGPEQRIETVPMVGRAAVVGIGPAGTQQVVAVVETAPGARRPGLASPDVAAAVRAAAGLPLAAVLVVPTLPTDVRHNSKIERTRLAGWASDVLGGGRMRRP